MKTSTHYRFAPAPGQFQRHEPADAPSACPIIHADDRPNPADDAKKADGSHDIGTDDGMHEIGLTSDFTNEPPQSHAAQPHAHHDAPDDIDLCALRRSATGPLPDEI